MAEIIAVLCLIAVAVMWHRIRMLKKDIYSFSDRLEQCLDAMISGQDIENFGELKDSLWDKIYEKLRKLDHMWLGQNQYNQEEKRQIKELISDISHQTKTPIANIKMYLEILENEEDAAWRTEFLGHLKGQTEKLDFLLQSLVKMSRLETGIIEISKQAARIYETLGRSAASIVPKAEQKGISLFADCDERLMAVYDKKWTEEAVFNILDNAVKYTPSGGSIHITVSVQEFFTKISIKDSGKGIARDRQAQIFGRFYREPEVHDEEGIGVGLYLARKIITLQNGYIEVVSEPGKGADFQIYLPNEAIS